MLPHNMINYNLCSLTPEYAVTYYYNIWCIIYSIYLIGALEFTSTNFYFTGKCTTCGFVNLRPLL